MERPLVYEFNDFRPYLAQWQKWRQVQEPLFTRTELVRRLGLPRTRSFFTDLLRGKPLTNTFLERLLPLMDLPRDEAMFLRALVKFNQAESAQERELYYEQLVVLNRSPRTLLDPKAFSYYKDWRNAALRATLGMVDWDGQDAQAISKLFQMRMTPGEIRKSFQVLKDLDLVERNDEGHWKPRHQVLSSGDGSADEAVRQHQLQCLELASMVILESPREKDRDTSTMFLSVSEEAAAVLRKRIEKFRSEIRSIVHKDTLPATRLLHMDLLLFPLIQMERA